MRLWPKIQEGAGVVNQRRCVRCGHFEHVHRWEWPGMYGRCGRTDCRCFLYDHPERDRPRSLAERALWKIGIRITFGH